MTNDPSLQVDDSALFPVIAELRVIKTEMELQALRYISKVSSDAHKVVMRKIKPGMKVRDRVQLQSISVIIECYNNR